jgi:hypothetical protein
MILPRKKKELKNKQEIQKSNRLMWVRDGWARQTIRQCLSRDRLLGFVLFLFYCIIIKFVSFRCVCVCVFYFLLLIWLLGRLNSRTQKFLATIVASSAVKKHRTTGWRRRKKPPANGKVVSFFSRILGGRSRANFRLSRGCCLIAGSNRILLPNPTVVTHTHKPKLREKQSGHLESQKLHFSHV